MPTQNLHINELPDSTIDHTCDQIATFTVGLQRLCVRDDVEELSLIGTGTLVVVCERHCIITAEHVLAQLKSSDRLALLTSFTGALRRPSYEQSHLQIFKIAKGHDDYEGPDIGLIVLPETNIGNLLAEKSFFNIDMRRQRFSKGFIHNEMGFWFTCGVIGESEMELPPKPGFRQIKGYRSLCGASTKPLEYQTDRFDYLEIRVGYEPYNPELPESFGGFSGGGIWHAPMRKTETGEIESEELHLSGVVFYQTAIEQGVRRLRGHGRRTIYSIVPQYLEQKFDSK